MKNHSPETLVLWDKLLEKANAPKWNLQTISSLKESMYGKKGVSFQEWMTLYDLLCTIVDVSSVDRIFWEPRSSSMGTFQEDSSNIFLKTYQPTLNGQLLREVSFSGLANAVHLNKIVTDFYVNMNYNGNRVFNYYIAEPHGTLFVSETLEKPAFSIIRLLGGAEPQAQRVYEPNVFWADLNLYKNYPGLYFPQKSQFLSEVKKRVKKLLPKVQAKIL